MKVPILLDHNQSKQIGYLKEQDGRLFFEFNSDANITREMFFRMFSCAGVKVLESYKKDGEDFIMNGIILEFSLDNSV